MKNRNIFFTLTLLLAAGSVWAQTEEDTRQLLLRVTNKKGKPVSGIVVHADSGGDVGITDARGTYVFPALKESDHIYLSLPKTGLTEVPVEGMDSIHVVIRSPRHVSYLNAQTKEPLNIGYGTVSYETNTLSVSNVEADKLVSQGSARDLYDLLRRVAGVTVNPDGSVIIRGATSLLLSTEPLVIVDGVASGTVAQVNDVISINDVKSISVLKEGSIYGANGANGVILITTK